MCSSSLNLCHAGIKEAREAKHLEVALTKDEIAYREQEHIAREVGKSVHEQSSSSTKAILVLNPTWAP